MSRFSEEDVKELKRLAEEFDETLAKMEVINNDLNNEELNLSWDERIAKIDEYNNYIVEYFGHLEDGVAAINESATNAYNSTMSLIDYKEYLGITASKGEVRLTGDSAIIRNSNFFDRKIAAESKMLFTNKQTLANVEEIARAKYLTANPLATEVDIQEYLKTVCA